MLDIEGLLTSLAQSRKVFHSEADFQHALAWQIHKARPDSPYAPRLMNLVRQFLRLKVIALHLGGFYMLEAAERELIGL